MFGIVQGGRYGAAEYRLPHWLHVIVVFVLMATMLASTSPSRVFALSAGDLTFSLITPFLAQDSNDSCVAGPKASYIEVLVTNPVGGTGALSNLTADLSAFAGAAGVTLDAGESATRYIGNSPYAAKRTGWSSRRASKAMCKARAYNLALSAKWLSLVVPFNSSSLI